jgi:hypothetical protein
MIAGGCGQGGPASAPLIHSVPEFVQVPPGQLEALTEGSNEPQGSVVISAQRGGHLTVGRFELDFAPGALLNDTEITMTDVTNRVGFVQCQLEPEGTVFHARVTLNADFSDLVSPTTYTMYWHVPSDDSGEVWLNVGGTPTGDGRGIITQLQHFSDYAPGKAGW